MVNHYINGEWVKSGASETVAIINPATEEVLDHTPMGTVKEVDLAVNAAKEAFKIWRKTPAPDRIQYLFKIKTLLEENFEDLVKLCSKEHGRGAIELAVVRPIFLMSDFEISTRPANAKTGFFHFLLRRPIPEIVFPLIV